MANLTNSITTVQKATYVPLNIDLPAGYTGRVALKFGYIRQLNLQPGEVDAVHGSLSEANTAAPGSGLADANFWSLLQQFEGSPLVSQLPSPSVFANIAEPNIISFGNGLTTLRRQTVQSLQQKATTAAPGAPPPVVTQSLASASNLLNTSSVATNAFTSNTSTSNVGCLNLERIEMTPDGVERGALLATIPLAPKERTAVVQQEWSVTSQEFTSIVTDSLENYSQTGVTENTQLAQSTTSQIAHNNQFNVTASASGGIGFISGSVSSSFGSQDQSSQSATDSRQQAIQTTRQASSRVKQSHKVTISTSTVTGASQTSTRTFENPSATDPMRVDYFSLMRKWYVALYRYGLRLTYDITVPEPAAALREAYAQLAGLQAQAAQGFTFPLKNSDITPAAFNDPNSTLWSYASQWGAQVPPPPASPPPITQSTTPTVGQGWFANDMPINIPDGSWITGFDIVMHIKKYSGGSSVMRFAIDGGYYSDSHDPGGLNADGLYTTEPASPFVTGHFTLDPNFLYEATGTQTISFYLQDMGYCHIWLQANLDVTPTAQDQWVSSVWTALYNAAQTAFYAQQQTINSQIQALQTKLNGVDTLTLRREENDEIMKCVLRWLLGPNFEFMPQALIQELVITDAFNPAGIFNGVNFTGNDVSPEIDWSLVSWDQERVNFINQAIDWSSVVYFLYSYFWDIPTSWDFIRQIQHPDSTRQAFLRAGSARVILTVRKGWELAWTWFVETGQTTLPSPLPQHPYLTIAQQIADYDNTNYPGIPPANPNGGGPIDDDTPQVGTTCVSNIQPGATATTPVSIPVASSAGFLVGATAIVDAWNATGSSGNSIQETQTITAVDTNANTITVQGLLYAHSTASGPFPVVQASAKGALIGEWYEYTPTSGTDIAIATPSGTKYCDNGQFGGY